MQDRRQRRRHKARVAGGCFALAIVFGLAAGVLPGGLVLAGAVIATVAGILMLNDHGAVPVLVYHSVSDSPDWLPWAANTSVRPKVFNAHLDVLRRGGWTVIPSQTLFEARQTGAELPRRPVVLHFDDGYLDNHVAAAPILRDRAMPATFFVSRDFIDPSETARPRIDADKPLIWDGYMNATELRALDADPLFEVACHGTDHGRVAVGPGTVDVLTAENWKRHVPWLWAQTPGNKALWHHQPTSPLPYGTPVPETDSALCTGAWSAESGAEPDAVWQDRVSQDLTDARQSLVQLLGREVTFLCWPFDRVTPKALELARAAGFTTFTGGRGENREGENPYMLSRVHVNDHAAGLGAPIWVEALVFRARLGVAAGQLWWLPLSWAAARQRAARYDVDHVPPDAAGESEAA